MQLSQVILIVIYLCRSLFFTVVLVWHCTAVCVVANMGFMREGLTEVSRDPHQLDLKWHSPVCPKVYFHLSYFSGLCGKCC